MAGIVHDIGKISVPAEILSKSGKITDIEMSLIRVHSQSGYDILKDAELPYPIAEIVLLLVLLPIPSFITVLYPRMSHCNR
jgi:HD-GYP domain-containing protein (c-di-GMP phosphodiesterase class II)